MNLITVWKHDIKEIEDLDKKEVSEIFGEYYNHQKNFFADRIDGFKNLPDTNLICEISTMSFLEARYGLTFLVKLGENRVARVSTKNDNNETELNRVFTNWKNAKQFLESLVFDSLKVFLRDIQSEEQKPFETICYALQ